MGRSRDPLLTLPDKGGVLYVRLYQRMRALIIQGDWPPGMRLPSSRTLAADLGISRNTAVLALDQLLADGWTETRSRAGTFVGRDLPLPGASVPAGEEQLASSARPPVPFELSHGAIDAFPFDRWARLQSKVWSNFVPDLLYQGAAAGDSGLRHAIATVLAPASGISAPVDNFVIIGSTISGFDLVAAALPKGATVVLEDPGYIFAEAPFRQRGCTIVPIMADSHGLDVAAARRAAPNPAAIVTTSAAQFPLGVPLSDARRWELLEWADETGAWVIDDRFDAETRFDGLPPATPLQAEDHGGRVITVFSLSRMLFRSLRLGFMIVPSELRQEILKARAAMDGFEPLPNQLVLREFIDRGFWSAHMRKTRELHRQRRDALIDALRPYLGTLFDAALNPCGLHLVLKPRGTPSGEVAKNLRASGIACVTLSELTRTPPAPEGILLGFGAFSPDVIDAMRPAIDSALGPLAARSG